MLSAFVFALSVGILAGASKSQTTQFADSLRRDRPLTTNAVTPNGTSRNGRDAFIITTDLTGSPLLAPGGAYRIEGTNTYPCDLIVRAGGTLILEDVFLQMRGDIILEEGGLIRIVDSEISLQCSRPLEFNVNWKGGHLSTLRTLIGGDTLLRQTTTFNLDWGLWTARDTVVENSAGILIGAYAGRQGDLRRRGGRLVADGLFGGRGGDFISMSGFGEAVLKNSAFGIVMRLYEASGQGATAVNLDLPSNRLIPARVYGDSGFHNSSARPPVTSGFSIPGSPWRLELENTTVTGWKLSIYDVGVSRSARTYIITSQDPVPIGLHGELIGSPSLVNPGTWATWYPVPPQLPTTGVPGGHGIPPNCGVQMGAITIMSPAANWSYVSNWSFYLRHNSDFLVRGATRIGELFLSHNSQMTLEGNEAYDAGLLTVACETLDDSILTIRNATVGSEDYLTPVLLATGRSRVLLQDVRYRKVLLETGFQSRPGPGFGIGSAAIKVERSFPSDVQSETFISVAIPSGSIDLGLANSSENTDVQNLNFAAPVVGGVPSFWKGVNVAGVASAVTSPASLDAQSFRYQASSTAGSSGKIYKRLKIKPGARVHASGWARSVVAAPGVVTRCAIAGSTGTVVSTPLVLDGLWHPFQLPTYTMQPGDVSVDFQVAHSNLTGPTGLQVLVDDLEFRVSKFWETDNLINLGFEEASFQGIVASAVADRSPDFWSLRNGDASVAAPRSGVGSASVLVTATGAAGVARDRTVLLKDLEYPRAGRSLQITGYVRGVPVAGQSFPIWIYVGEGRRYFETTTKQQHAADGTWRFFSLNYTIPNPKKRGVPSTLAITGGSNGDQLFVDDVKVTIQ